MIRADRRGGTPEYTHSASWNENENVESAVITHLGKTCEVPKSKVWVNTNNHSKTPYFKFATDQQFIDEIIKPLCG